MADQSNSEIFSNLGATYLAAREARQAGASPFAAMMQGFVGAKGVQERAADPYFALRSTLMRQQSEALNLNLANLVTQREIELQQRKGLAEFNSEFSKAMADGTVGDPSTTSVLLDTMGKYGIPYQAVKPALDQVKAAGDAKNVQKFAQALSTPRPEVTGVIPGGPVPLPVVEQVTPTMPEAMAKAPFDADQMARMLSFSQNLGVRLRGQDIQRELGQARITAQAKRDAESRALRQRALELTAQRLDNQQVSQDIQRARLMAENLRTQVEGKKINESLRRNLQAQIPEIKTLDEEISNLAIEIQDLEAQAAEGGTTGVFGTGLFARSVESIRARIADREKQLAQKQKALRHVMDSIDEVTGNASTVPAPAPTATGPKKFVYKDGQLVPQ